MDCNCLSLKRNLWDIMWKLCASLPFFFENCVCEHYVSLSDFNGDLLMSCIYLPLILIEKESTDNRPTGFH